MRRETRFPMREYPSSMVAKWRQKNLPIHSITSDGRFASALHRGFSLFLVAVLRRELRDLVVLLANVIDLLDQLGHFLGVGFFRVQALQYPFGRLHLLQASLEVSPELRVVGVVLVLRPGLDQLQLESFVLELPDQLRQLRLELGDLQREVLLLLLLGVGRLDLSLR